MEESWRNSKPSTSGGSNGLSRTKAFEFEDDERIGVGDDDGEITYTSCSDNDNDDAASGTSSSSSTASSSSENCPICLNRLRRQVVGNPECCEHVFCFDCISEWSKCTATCPIDRISFASIIVKDACSGRILRRESVETRGEENDASGEEDLTYCEVCQRSDREDRLLLCDGCDHGYHLDCLTPPLDSVPLDAWFCPRCNREDISDPITRRQRRAIPRTRANERVRARIARAVEQQENSQESSEEEASDASSYESDDGIVYSVSDALGLPASAVTQLVRRKPRRRRRLRKRRITRRKTIKRAPKSKVAKSSTKKRSRRRRKRKWRPRRKFATKNTLKRSNSDPNLIRNERDSVAMVKKRLADRLGIVKPPKKGQHLPVLKSAPASELPSSSGQLSIFGNENALIAFSDEIDNTGAAGCSHPQRVEKPATISDKAKRFRTPLYLSKKCSVGLMKHQRRSEAPAEDDLLGGILKEQSLLMAPSSSVLIKRDGSLAEKAHRARSNMEESTSLPADQGKLPTATLDVAVSDSLVTESKNRKHWNSEPVKPLEESGQKRRKTSDDGSPVRNESVDQKRKSVVDTNDKKSIKPVAGSYVDKTSGSDRASTAETTKRVPPAATQDYPGPVGGSYLPCIHPPPVASSAPIGAAPPVRKKGPLLPSPSIPPTKPANIGHRSSGLRQHTDNNSSLGDGDVALPLQQAGLQANGAPLRYAVPVSLPANSSPPMNKMMDDSASIQQQSAAMIAAKIQQNLLLQQQQVLLGMTSTSGRMSPSVDNDALQPLLQQSGFAMQLMNSASAVGQQQQQLLAAQQRLSNASTDQQSLEALMSSAASNTVPSFLAPPNLAAAAAMQTALAAAAARQHQVNFLSSLRAATVASAHQQLHHGFMPAFVTAGGVAPGALLAGSGLPPIWHHQLMNAQPPPPPPPPPPPDLQLIPLPPPYAVSSANIITAPPPPPPPPPVPPPARDADIDTSRLSLDARISEIEMDNNVPPELVSLLHQFAQIKKEQQQQSQSQRATDSGPLRGSAIESKNSHSFGVVAVSPASSDNSLLILDMAMTTPTPEPAEPTPATMADDNYKNKKQRNSVKFGADVVEADERKVKLSKAEIKQKKREERLRKMLNEAKKGSRTTEHTSAEVDTDDGVPSSAVDLKRREKVMAKFSYQLQVEEAVKVGLRPYYSKRKITKEEYKDIMRKCVPKVCKKKAEIKPEKIKAFVDTCVAKVLASKSKRGAVSGEN